MDTEQDGRTLEHSAQSTLSGIDSEIVSSLVRSHWLLCGAVPGPKPDMGRIEAGPVKPC